MAEQSTLRLDHVVIAVHDLDEAVKDYAAMGFNPIKGGVHAGGATHNALIYLADGSYIELISRTGEPFPPDALRFDRLNEGTEGLTGYALVTPDLVGELAQLGIQQPIRQGGRRRPDGVQLEWKSARLGDHFWPFLIEDVTPRELRVPGDVAVIAQENEVTGIVVPQVVLPGPAPLTEVRFSVKPGARPAFPAHLLHGVTLVVDETP